MIRSTIAFTLIATCAWAADPFADRHRSPSDLALSADGKWILTANAGSDSATLIDVATGKVVAEVAVGKSPFAAAIAPDGKRGVITNKLGNSVTLVEWNAGADLKPVAEIPVGHEPRGVVFAADGKTAFVVCCLDDKVAVLDWAARRVASRFDVGQRPWHLALSLDGSRLAVSNSRSSEVMFFDAATLKPGRSIKTSGDALRHVAFSPDGKWAHVPHLYGRGWPTTKDMIGRGWVLANHVARCPVEGSGGRQSIALDVNTKAVGEADGIAVSRDNKWIVVTAGGTKELLILKNADIPWIEYGGPEDFIDNKMLQAGRFRRVPLGGKPAGVVLAADSRTAYIANYFENSVQIVDVVDAKLVGSIALGSAPSISLERRGEMVFCDATLSFHQWYSCNACHADGHTINVAFDTFNDKAYGKMKKTVSLRNVAETGPWTWHGWQGDLTGGATVSVMESMRGEPLKPADAEALIAYLKTLDYPANPHRNADGSFTEAGKRGEKVFNSGKAGCAKCHNGDHFTDGLNHNVGTGEGGDRYPTYNTPGLRGTYDRAPYLHDGRAKTLESLLTRHHNPDKVTKKGALTSEELKDLIEYLKQL